MAKRANKPEAKTEVGYADNIAIAVIAGIVIVIAVIFAVAHLGQASVPTLPGSPSNSPTPSPTDSDTPSPTFTPSPTPSYRMSPAPTRSSVPTPSPTTIKQPPI